MFGFYFYLRLYFIFILKVSVETKSGSGPVKFSRAKPKAFGWDGTQVSYDSLMKSKLISFE